ncbi:MAG: hypothetical protein CMJ21_06225 [Phycisphaerae bacterium]|jgi:hypothetical protein|nr:hypothetical protein [Phycisphaerae bacterium]
MTQFTYDTKDAVQIVSQGEYEAVIFSAETGKTKKGDPKLVITSKIYGPEGRSPLVTDNIVSPYGIRRLKQLCEATGVEFNDGEVNPQDFVGKNVKVKVVVEHDDTGKYDDRNGIRAYLPDDGSPAPEVVTRPETPTDQSDRSGGKLDAWKGYCDAVRKTKPDVEDDLLIKNFQSACKDLVGKPEDQFTEPDWIKVRDEGPKGFIPF